jgi:GTP-binding protein LepA
LASCQGALLLVDSTQSVQAQTLANFNKAKSLNLGIIPVVTKIDLPNAQPDEAAKTMSATFNVTIDSVIKTSAKQNIGVDDVLQAIVDRLPPPPLKQDTHAGTLFKGRIVDSWFNEHRGVVILIQCTSGELHEGYRITAFASIREAKDIDNRKDFSVQGNLYIFLYIFLLN